MRESRNIDTILLIGSLANEATAKTRAEELAAVTASTEQPIILSTYTTATEGAMAAFAEAGIPCYTSMPSCARAIRALVDYARFQARRDRAAPPPTTPPASRDEAARGLALAGRVLTENRAKALLAGYGIPRPPEALAVSADQAVAASIRIGGAVALKVQSPDITHKTEAGAVALGIAGEAAVREAYARVLANAKAAHPDAAVEGVLVQRMAPPGVEIILGITRDPVFGPMLMVGLGGIHVEVLRDVAFSPVPIGPDEALALLGELKGAALLDGVRGAPPADRAALAELIAALSRFAADHADRIDEIDLNPVILHSARPGSDHRRRADRQALTHPLSLGNPTTMESWQSRAMPSRLAPIADDHSWGERVAALGPEGLFLINAAGGSMQRVRERKPWLGCRRTLALSPQR